MPRDSITHVEISGEERTFSLRRKKRFLARPRKGKERLDVPSDKSTWLKYLRSIFVSRRAKLKPSLTIYITLFTVIIRPIEHALNQFTGEIKRNTDRSRNRFDLEEFSCVWYLERQFEIQTWKRSNCLATQTTPRFVRKLLLLHLLNSVQRSSS